MSDRLTCDAREFDRRATFQRPVNSRTTAGDMEIAWTTVFTAWVGLRKQNLSERLKEPVVADELQSPRDYILRIRADTVERNAVQMDWRVLLDNVEYDIKAITDDKAMSRVVEMQIRAGINNG